MAIFKAGVTFSKAEGPSFWVSIRHISGGVNITRKGLEDLKFFLARVLKPVDENSPILHL